LVFLLNFFIWILSVGWFACFLFSERDADLTSRVMNAVVTSHEENDGDVTRDERHCDVTEGKMW
jgi:hypothetical protein